MELKEFVKDTILQICNGVKEAQDAGKEIGAVINPPMRSAEQGIVHEKGDRYIALRLKTDIHFKAVLQQAKGDNGRQGIGVMLGNVVLGASKDERQDLSSLTSVDFSVPVALPLQEL